MVFWKWSIIHNPEGVCMLSHFSHVPSTIARQAPLSLGFPRQEYWSGLPFPPRGDLLNSKIKPASPMTPALQADTLPVGHQGSPGGLVVNNPPDNARAVRGPGSIPGSGRSPRGGNGNPLQYSCLEKSHGQGPGRQQSMGVTWSQT